ncbi:MAG: hypothetical protein IKD79_03690 [Oscillospiraceae bacterium]|nr:hypothetical protein [Oscillospiraceae bacterium]
MARLDGRGRVLCVILLLGLIAALVLTGQRVQLERLGRNAAAVMAWSDIADLAAASGEPEEVWLSALTEHGLTAVVLESDGGVFDAAAAEKIRSAGLSLTLAPDGPMTAETYQAQRTALGAEFPVYLASCAAEGLEESGLLIGLVEDEAQYSHFPIDGFNSAESTASMIRVFRLLPDVAARYGAYGYEGAEEIVQVLCRAAVDRSARVLWLTPLTNAADGAPVTDVSVYTDVLDDLSAALARRGIDLNGDVTGLAPRFPSVPLLAVSEWGLAAALLLFLRTLVRLPKWPEIVLLILGTLYAFGAAWYAPHTALPVMALGAAVVFPCLAVWWFITRLTAPTPERRLPLPLGSLLALVGGLVVVLIGCVFISGILSGSDYMLSILSFRGVKVSQGVPLLYTLFLVWRHYWHKPSELVRRSEERKGAMAAAAVVCIVIVLAVGVFFVAGTGDEGFLRGGLWERRLRGFLELTLPVRPRLKELLCAWPALVLAVQMLRRRRRVWATALTLVTAAGFASVTNTFCHIRASVGVSLMRTGLGAGFGWLIGLLAALIVWLLFFRDRWKEEAL